MNPANPAQVACRPKFILDLVLIATAAAAPDRAGKGWASLGGKASSPPRQPKSRFPRLIIILQTQPKDQILNYGT
jgi:hypothetical protein